MTRFPPYLALVIALGLATQAIAQRFPAFDAERFLSLGDADLDGRLSFDEYRDFMRSSPRMRDSEVIEPMFRRLDTNGDGFLSLSEYRKSFPPRPTAGQSGSASELVAVAEASATAEQFAAITPEQEQFFEAKIRPVLVVQCGKCHASAAEKLRGELRLDSREGLLVGGDSGPVIVPGKPEESLLIEAIRYRNEDLRMPPDGKLADAVINDFEVWVAMGAPDPRKTTDTIAASDRAGALDFWSFRPPKKASPPAVKRPDWPRGEIDGFLLAALESRGLAPVGDATRQRLLRRV